jgi:hypothetical protein
MTLKTLKMQPKARRPISRHFDPAILIRLRIDIAEEATEVADPLFPTDMCPRETLHSAAESRCVVRFRQVNTNIGPKNNEESISARLTQRCWTLGSWAKLVGWFLQWFFRTDREIRGICRRL